jgi:hypothetical protein
MRNGEEEGGRREEEKRRPDEERRRRSGAGEGWRKEERMEGRRKGWIGWMRKGEEEGGG